MIQDPSVGRVVHYVSYGTPGGEYPSVCRAAVITEVGGWVTVTKKMEESYSRSEGRAIRHLEQWFFTDAVGVCVLNPTGQFFNELVRYSPGDPAEHAAGARCAGGDRLYPGGTWHWPERI